MSETADITAESSLLSPKPVVGNKTSIVRTAQMAVACLFVFLSFSVSQLYQTSSDHEDTGSLALGVLYACFTLSNFVIASYVTGKLGARLSLAISSLTYGGFVAANIKYNAPLLFAASALLGVGASVIWTAHGVFVTQCAKYHEYINRLPDGSTMGELNGIFWSIFQVNQFLGNLLAALLFHYNVDTSTIFIILSIICFSGSGMMFMLKSPGQIPVASDDTAVEAKKRSIWGVLAMLKDKRIQMLLPIMIFSGLSQGYVFGDFPPLIADKSRKFFVMSALGFVNATSSFVLGRLSDRLGRLTIVFTGAVAFAVPLTAFLFGTISQDQPWLFFAAAALLGIGDGCFNTQIYAILGTFFDKNSESAFANYKLFQAGSTAAVFLYRSYLGFVARDAIVLGFLVVGVIMLFVLNTTHKLHAETTTTTRKPEEEPINSYSETSDTALLK